MERPPAPPELVIDLADEITREFLVTKDGQVVHARLQEPLGVRLARGWLDPPKPRPGTSPLPPASRSVSRPWGAPARAGLHRRRRADFQDSLSAGSRTDSDQLIVEDPRQHEWHARQWKEDRLASYTQGRRSTDDRANRLPDPARRLAPRSEKDSNLDARSRSSCPGHAPGGRPYRPGTRRAPAGSESTSVLWLPPGRSVRPGWQPGEQRVAHEQLARHCPGLADREAHAARAVSRRVQYVGDEVTERGATAEDCRTRPLGGAWSEVNSRTCALVRRRASYRNRSSRCSHTGAPRVAPASPTPLM